MPDREFSHLPDDEFPDGERTPPPPPILVYEENGVTVRRYAPGYALGSVTVHRVRPRR